MVVLDATALGGALLGGPYAQGAPQLKLVQKRYLGIHHWLSPVATKDLKEQIVSSNKIVIIKNCSTKHREKHSFFSDIFF